MKSIRLALFLSAASLAAPALAQDAKPAEKTAGDDFHNRDISRDTIVVSAAGLERLDVLAGTSVLEGNALQRDLESQIGDTIAKLPGVSTSGFAPGASRPILRGLSGERIRVLTDGVGSIDASAVSDDHSGTVDPLIASSIEVLRGPAALLYGSQAIGGAVNVITKRIPPSVPDEPVHVDGIVGVDSASDRVEGGASIDFALGKEVAFHIDGSYRETGDLEIPGFVATPALRAKLLAQAAEEEEEGHLDEAAEFRDGANASGKLPNSATRTSTVGVGLAWHSGQNMFGISADYYDTNYGIPGLPGVGHVHEHGDEDHGDEDDHDHDHEEEGPVTIGMQRYRVDARGALDLGEGFFDLVQAKFGYSDYTHTEFEGRETGTRFDVEGVEGRLELVQNNRNGWGGSLGMQYSHVDFRADGDEAFVAPNTTENWALFAVQQFDIGKLGLQAGARYEHSAVDVDFTDGSSLSRDFDAFSASAGVSYALIEGYEDDLRIGINGSRAERAPVAQELVADGPHVATQAYEIGDPTLDTEVAWGLEGYVRGSIGRALVSASVYHTWFDGFIYLDEADRAPIGGLEVFEFLQQDARQFGVEGQVTFPLIDANGFRLNADLRGDYVRATLDDGSPVPRIPPLSALAALEAQVGHFDIRGEVETFAKQDRVSEHESPTDGFTFVNASVAWHPIEGQQNFTLLAQVDNIFDVEGRRHTSFTKEYTPLSGRNFKLSARVSF
ncbi:TonB-dependent receptor [Aurantiacibacter xanthus]|uniref:TonB-dependent receptor n=1 Tax=Aurantiacibacter xanthus TaxID=1784712 RepID=A0A3A1P334_9SPHN|nr:TonB-dependent receptor [Aurantiacibacter xanthus]RIV82918.1 TonB-dependent receptor [Aurantiacibacter xanthus]